MAVQFDDIRVATMLELYERLLRERSCSRIEVLEAALDFTLSEERDARSVAQLRRDVLRNAEFCVNRTAMTRRQAAERYPLADASHRRFTWSDESGVVEVDIETRVTPDAELAAEEAFQALDAFARTLGSYGSLCLRALIADATTAETAEAAKVSVSTVERCWRALRAEARAMSHRDGDAEHH